MQSHPHFAPPLCGSGKFWRIQTHVECTVEYDGLLHRWIRRWAKGPILHEQTLLHRSHGHAVLVLLTTWCLRAARFLCRLATRASSKAAMAVRHVERHCPRSSGARALTTDCGCMPPSILASPDWSALWACAGMKAQSCPQRICFGMPLPCMWTTWPMYLSELCLCSLLTF